MKVGEGGIYWRWSLEKEKNIEDERDILNKGKFERKTFSS